MDAGGLSIQRKIIWGDYTLNKQDIHINTILTETVKLLCIEYCYEEQDFIPLFNLYYYVYKDNPNYLHMLKYIFIDIPSKKVFVVEFYLFIILHVYRDIRFVDSGYFIEKKFVFFLEIFLYEYFKDSIEHRFSGKAAIKKLNTNFNYNLLKNKGKANLEPIIRLLIIKLNRKLNTYNLAEVYDEGSYITYYQCLINKHIYNFLIKDKVISELMYYIPSIELNVYKSLLNKYYTDIVYPPTVKHESLFSENNLSNNKYFYIKINKDIKSIVGINYLFLKFTDKLISENLAIQLLYKTQHNEQVLSDDIWKKLKLEDINILFSTTFNDLYQVYRHFRLVIITFIENYEEKSIDELLNLEVIQLRTKIYTPLSIINNFFDINTEYIINNIEFQVNTLYTLYSIYKKVNEELGFKLKGYLSLLKTTVTKYYEAFNKYRYFLFFLEKDNLKINYTFKNDFRGRFYVNENSISWVNNNLLRNIITFDNKYFDFSQDTILLCDYKKSSLISQKYRNYIVKCISLILNNNVEVEVIGFDGILLQFFEIWHWVLIQFGISYYNLKIKNYDLFYLQLLEILKSYNSIDLTNKSLNTYVFLSKLKEFFNCVNSGGDFLENTIKFQSKLPQLKLDSSCNGLTHITLAFIQNEDKFQFYAKNLNLLDFNYKFDFYEVCIDSIYKNLGTEVHIENNNYYKLLKINTITYWQNIWLENFSVLVCRSLIKSIVMIIPYGGTIYTIVDLVKNHLSTTTIIKNHLYLNCDELLLTEFSRFFVNIFIMPLYKDLVYDSNLILNKINDHKIENIYLKFNQDYYVTLKYNTKLHSKVVCSYLNKNLTYNYIKPSNTVDIRKTKQATLPNIIHSYDSFVCSLLLKKFPFILPIHDCFIIPHWLGSVFILEYNKLLLEAHEKYPLNSILYINSINNIIDANKTNINKIKPQLLKSIYTLKVEV